MQYLLLSLTRAGMTPPRRPVVESVLTAQSSVPTRSAFSRSPRSLFESLLSRGRPFLQMSCLAQKFNVCFESLLLMHLVAFTNRYKNILSKTDSPPFTFVSIASFRACPPTPHPSPNIADNNACLP